MQSALVRQRFKQAPYSDRESIDRVLFTVKSQEGQASP